MTIHGAKGLEFENVFLPGWEEGLFPSQQTMDEKGKEGLEEERRLAYVAITRAKSKLWVSFAASRMVFGNVISSIPSRFVDELPADSVESHGGGSGSGRGLGPGYKSRNQTTNLLKASIAEKKPATFVAPSSSNGFKTSRKENNSKFGVGDRIFHQKFGYGRVLNINGKHLQIVFEKSSIKTLLEDYVNAA